MVDDYEMSESVMIVNIRDMRESVVWISGGVRLPSPPRHDTTAPEEPTPARVQPPRQAKTKDVKFHYTK